MKDQNTERDEELGRHKFCYTKHIHFSTIISVSMSDVLTSIAERAKLSIPYIKRS